MSQLDCVTTSRVFLFPKEYEKISLKSDTDNAILDILKLDSSII